MGKTLQRKRHHLLDYEVGLELCHGRIGGLSSNYPDVTIILHSRMTYLALIQLEDCIGSEIASTGAIE